MDLGLTVKTFGGGDQRWLGSATGTTDATTVTLDIAKFASFKSTHGDIIPAGTPLKVSDTGGKYEPLTQKTEKLAGFLLVAQPNKGTVQVAPMMWHGRIRADKLPADLFDVSTLTTPNPQFTIVKEVK
ncbi:hypothetical protein [Corynebacterium aquilae]|uniref:hypothetical protein n=1 Tax=Corynebacterium aquilae TaxID=203263 RepID=UPI000953243C|nr:hypothetical protein [Corynebacterium aquilae]